MENEEEIKEVEEEIEAEEEDDCNDFLRMPEIDFDLSIELPTAADLLGYDED
jgi:hypothetical protein